MQRARSPFAPRLLPALPILALLAGCGGDADRDASVAVRDSAGVTIVESAAPLWAEGEAWTLSAEPVLSVGALDGPAELQLHRVAAALRLPDGRIVVADGGSHQLRFFGPDGGFLRAVGRQGAGPGEFQGIWSAYTAGDSIFVADAWLQRVSVFTTEGEFVRTDSPTAGGEFPFFFPVGRFADGSWAFAAHQPVPPDGSRTGVVRDSSLVFRFPAVGGDAVRLGGFPGSEFYARGSGATFAIQTVPFGRQAAVVALGDRFVFGSAERYELDLFTPDGRLERRIRRAHRPEPVTDADLQAWDRAHPPQTFPGGVTMLSAAEIPRAASKPAHGAVMIDRGGNLWVSAPPHPASTDAVSWDVFDPEGRWLGAVSLPGRFHVTDIGADYVLGVFRDDLDVEHVRLYRLHKP